MVHLQDGLNIKYLIKKINLTSYLMLTDQKQNMRQGKTNKQTNKQTNKLTKTNNNDNKMIVAVYTKKWLIKRVICGKILI